MAAQPLTLQQFIALLQAINPGTSPNLINSLAARDYPLYLQNPEQSLAAMGPAGGQLVQGQGQPAGSGTIQGGMPAASLAALIQGGGAGGGGAATSPSSYLGTTTPGTMSMPTISYPGAPPALTQPGAAANLFSADQWQQFANASPATQEMMGTQLGLGSSDIAEFSRAAATAVAQQQAAIQAQRAAQAQQPLPEQNALTMMGQIDPAGEATRNALASSYLTPLAQAQNPTAGQFQSLLDIYGQVDPTAAAARTKLGQDLASQEALGTQLDPQTIRELEQSTRAGQVARGNVYGTPQLVAEAMTRGQAGMAIQQQRQQALQSYLSSGVAPGDLAMNLYQTQQGNVRAAQNQALGFLGSGQTPLGAASSYLGGAEAAAAAAAQGGPAYNAGTLGSTYTGAGAAQFPQYGIDTSQLANQWYNSLGAYGGGGYGGTGSNVGKAIGGAATGALSGAASGAALGSAALPGIGTAVGAVAGGLVGGLGGGASYFA